jgi:thioredoxin reductase
MNPKYGRVVCRCGTITEGEIVDTMVVDISKDKYVSIVNSKDGFVKVKAKAIILATGCKERKRGAIGIAGKRPSGIFTAGTAQKNINIEGYMVGKKIII